MSVCLQPFPIQNNGCHLVTIKTETHGSIGKKSNLWWYSLGGARYFWVLGLNRLCLSGFFLECSRFREDGLGGLEAVESFLFRRDEVFWEY